MNINKVSSMGTIGLNDGCKGSTCQTGKQVNFKGTLKVDVFENMCSLLANKKPEEACDILREMVNGIDLLDKSVWALGSESDVFSIVGHKSPATKKFFVIQKNGKNIDNKFFTPLETKSPFNVITQFINEVAYAQYPNRKMPWLFKDYVSYTPFRPMVDGSYVSLEFSTKNNSKNIVKAKPEELMIKLLQYPSKNLDAKSKLNFDA